MEVNEAAAAINALGGGEAEPTEGNASNAMSVEQAADVILAMDEPEAEAPVEAESQEEFTPEPEPVTGDAEQYFMQSQQALAQGEAQLQLEAQRLQAIEAQLPKLKQSNPEQYSKVLAETTARRVEIHEASQQLAAQHQQLAGQALQYVEDKIQAEKDALVKAVPEFGDPESAKKVKAQIKKHLRNQGFTPQEIDAISDHRVVVTAYKAVKAEKAAKPKPKLPKKFRKAKKNTLEAQLKKANVRNPNSMDAAAMRIQGII